MTTPAFVDVVVGQQLPSRSFPVSKANLVMYAGASGDFNPIHWNDAVATAVGLPGTIAHGMLTMAIAGRVVTDWAQDPGAIVSYGVRFTRPVHVPDEGATVEVSGTVTDKGDDGLVSVSLTATFNGQTVLGKAVAVARLR